MVERIDGGALNLPKKVEGPRKEKVDSLESQGLSAFELPKDFAFSDVASVTEELRSRLTQVSEQMDAALGELSRYQTADQAHSEIKSIVDGVRQMQSEYQPGEIPPDLETRFAEMTDALRTVVSSATFEGEAVFTPGEALSHVMEAESFEYAWPYVKLAAAEVAAFGAETAVLLQGVSTRIAEAQVAYENIVSATTPANVSDVTDLLATDDTGATMEGLDLNRSNIIQILGS